MAALAYLAKLVRRRMAMVGFRALLADARVDRVATVALAARAVGGRVAQAQGSSTGAAPPFWTWLRALSLYKVLAAPKGQVERQEPTTELTDPRAYRSSCNSDARPAGRRNEVALMFRTAPEIAKWANLIRRLSARLTRVVFAGLAVVSLACGTSFTAGSPATESDASNLGEDASEGDTSIIVLPPPQADAGAQRDGGMCMITTEPKDTPCLVDETYGVFVSASGHDSAAGTKADPIKTITAGITKTLLGPKRVFVCSGTYDEHLVVGASQDGVG